MPADDLVSLSDAATIAERSERSIRRWIDAGKLSRHEGAPPDTGGPAPVRVSRSELLGLLATSGQQPRSAHPDAPPAPVSDTHPAHPDTAPGAVQVADQGAELARLRWEVERVRLEAEIERLRDRVASLEGTHARELDQRDREIARLVSDLASARDDVADWRGRHDAREAELRALRAERGIPWWRKLLGGPTVAIEG